MKFIDISRFLLKVVVMEIKLMYNFYSGDNMKVKISKNNMTNDEIKKVDVAKVYIPLLIANDVNVTSLVNVGEYVYKGAMIAKRKGDFRMPIHSSISGTVVDFTEMQCFNGSNIRCIVIENDFKEATNFAVEDRKINSFSTDEFIERIRDCGIIGMGGSGFPTYLKYQTENKKKTLIVNAVECEPYITSDFCLANKKCEEILETIDAILDINKMDECFIVMKKTNIKLKQSFDNFIGTYLKIKIIMIDNYYPAGWERTLVSFVKGVEYERFPIEQGIIVNNISTIYAIYEALKFNKPLVERVVTFTGDNIKNPANILIKSGTLVQDVLDVVGFTGNLLISGGPMMGCEIKSNSVMTLNQNCILAISRLDDTASQCLNCGKCVSVCPSKLCPVLIMKSKDCSKLGVSKCISCGLCTYVCPAKIDVREHMRLAKEGK